MVLFTKVASYNSILFIAACAAATKAENAGNSRGSFLVNFMGNEDDYGGGNDFDSSNKCGPCTIADTVDGTVVTRTVTNGDGTSTSNPASPVTVTVCSITSTSLSSSSSTELSSIGSSTDTSSTDTASSTLSSTDSSTTSSSTDSSTDTSSTTTTTTSSIGPALCGRVNLSSASSSSTVTSSTSATLLASCDPSSIYGTQSANAMENMTPSSQLDIAYDGNNYAWVVTADSLYISKGTDKSTDGAVLESIGKVVNVKGSITGIAFDSSGNLYYSTTGPQLLRANMKTPLTTTKLTDYFGTTINDLGACVWPKVDISSLLA
ncbi:hypothetical protein BGW37DRAFT_469595 [Umbelopsis sp. PMI_123]|nr:hypothetical protein BGW37DRAFT_469595 [Umbelopsis sp. PMI_123]